LRSVHVNEQLVSVPKFDKMELTSQDLKRVW
jgi:hypothetical protein